MDLETALLEGIHDNPDDEATWLVLGDWLEEQGRADQAELLRLRVALGKGADLDPRQGPVLEARQRMLLGCGVQPCVPARVNSVGMTLVLIPAGTFWMGSPADEPGRYSDEDPWHEVEITRPYYLSAHPVTQDQYQAVLSARPSHFSATGEGKRRVEGLATGSFPVENVSWTDANAFCAALSELPQEKAHGRVYRLPTEAEWEYACRAGVRNDAFHFGPSLSSFQANIDGNQPHGNAPTGPFLQRTSAVGSYPPNAWGLFDLHGNVWEWCSDWYDADYYERSPRKDPQGPASDSEGYRSIRGGSWNFRAATCRTAYRLRLHPEVRTYDVGFRVVCEAPVRPG